MDLKTGRGTVKAPWGNDDVTESLDSIRHCLKQLQHFQKQRDNAHLRADILGYEMILQTGIEQNADNFLETKDKSRRGVIRDFKNNLAVIEYLKENGLWAQKQ